jgi:hypothetical protein
MSVSPKTKTSTFFHCFAAMLQSEEGGTNLMHNIEEPFGQQNHYNSSGKGKEK